MSDSNSASSLGRWCMSCGVPEGCGHDPDCAALRQASALNGAAEQLREAGELIAKLKRDLQYAQDELVIERALRRNGVAPAGEI